MTFLFVIVDTQLLSKNQKSLLVKWLGIHVGFGKFKNCFKAANRGRVQAFHSSCDDKTNTITIIKNTAGKIFGGFTDVSFKTGDTDRSFLFDVDTGFKLGVVNASNAVCSLTSNGPYFGYKDLRVSTGYDYDYHIYYNAMNKYSSAIGSNYNSKKLKSLGNGSGSVAKLGVYHRIW